jgi:hypothetical protein
MMRLGLTPRMRRTYDFICARLDSVGIPPTYQEMAVHVGLVSRSGAVPIVKDLEARGWIVRRPQCARSIERAQPDAPPIPFRQKGSAMLVTGYDVLGSAFVDIPISVLVTGFRNGFSSHDMADDYAEAGVIVLESDIANALSQHSNEVHADRRAA